MGTTEQLGKRRIMTRQLSPLRGFIPSSKAGETEAREG